MNSRANGIIRIASVFTAALMLFSGCTSKELAQTAVVNANDYDGIYFDDNGNRIKDPLEIPVNTVGDITTADGSQTGEDTTASSENTEDTEQTTPPDETTTEPTETAPPTTEKTDDTSSEQTTTEITEPPVTSGDSLSQQEVALDTFYTNSYSAKNYSEVKGMWISYIELSSMLTGASESSFRSAISAAYNNCVELGINTVYVHVRPFGDALYQSDYFPWSKYCAGSICEEPDFDPLRVMIEEAHNKGLSFHAWINPFRTYSSDDAVYVSDDYHTGNWIRGKRSGTYASFVGSYWWLNPAYEDVRNLIVNGVSELVSRYDIDGIHMDDYFYPTTDESFDASAFAVSGYTSLSDFREDNVDKLVKALYNSVKSINPTCEYGISPQGNVENNYAYMYADVRKWCSSNGYIDYIAPQIYFGFKNDAQPYQTVLEKWQNMTTSPSVKLIVGLSVSKIGTTDSVYAGSGALEWVNDSEIIRRQIEAAKQMSRYGGFILYSYAYAFSTDPQNVAEMQAVKNLIK